MVIFLRPAKEGGDVLGPLQGVKNRLAELAREVVPDKTVQPNHGWRHRFTALCDELEISERVMYAITGHAPRTEGAKYGGVSLKAKAQALAKFPRYDVK